MEAALLTLIGGLLGIALSNVLVVLLELRRRQIREREIVVGVHAEILAGSVGVLLQEGSRETSYLRDFERSDAPIPFGIPDETDFVFLELKKDLTVLPTEVIHEVVAYYKASLQGNAYIQTFRGADFRGLARDRQTKLIQQYEDIVGMQARLSHQALRQLETYGARYQLGLDDRRQRFLERIGGPPDAIAAAPS